MDYITIFIIIIFIVCILIRIGHKVYKKRNIYKKEQEEEGNINKVVFYDGSSLSNQAQKKKKKNISSVQDLARNRKVDCNSNIIECDHNSDCHSKCIYYYTRKTSCINGMCGYKNNTKSMCENGGQIASYFSLGRTITACICPDNFIGPFCQIPNEMKPSDSRIFDIIY